MYGSKCWEKDGQDKSLLECERYGNHVHELLLEYSFQLNLGFHSSNQPVSMTFPCWAWPTFTRWLADHKSITVLHKIHHLPLDAAFLIGSHKIWFPCYGDYWITMHWSHCLFPPFWRIHFDNIVWSFKQFLTWLLLTHICKWSSRVMLYLQTCQHVTFFLITLHDPQYWTRTKCI